MNDLGPIRRAIPLPARRVARFARRAMKAAVGKDHLIALDVAVPRRRYGQDWADWVLAPQFLSSRSVVYSFGLGRDISFEESLIQDVGCEIHGFDPTPISLDYVRSLGSNPKLHLYAFGLSSIDGEKDFGAPSKDDCSFSTQVEAAGGVRLPVRTLASLKRELGHDHIDLLKMDIEGEEYAVIDDMIACGILPDQLLVEFHHAWNMGELKDTRATVRRLHEAGYRIFDISAAGREFSFIRARLLQ